MIIKQKMALSLAMFYMFFTSVGLASELAISPEAVHASTLEELLDISASIASSKPELIPKTPAVVSTYYASDLRKMGLRNLKDMLSSIPGISITNSYGSSVVSIRGIYEAFNQKVLLLLNDVPYFMPSHSDIPLQGIPIESILRVEVIRGPGAVYHGNKASSGVINIITKEGSGIDLSLSVDTNGQFNQSGFLTHELGENHYISAAYEIQNGESYEGFTSGAPNSTASPAQSGLPTSGSVALGENMTSTLFRYQNQNTHVMLQLFESDVGTLAGNSTVFSDSVTEQFGSLLHINQNIIGARYDANLYADYNQHYLSILMENQAGIGVPGRFQFEDNGAANYRWRAGGDITFDLNESLSLFFLHEVEKRSISPYQFINDQTGAPIIELTSFHDVFERSYAAQFDLDLDKFRFLLGGRYTDNALSGEKTTPRVSLIYSLSDSKSLKLLYSEGFNAPNFLQQFVKIPPLLSGNPDLEAESIRTTDLVYTHHANDRIFVTNVYYMEAHDFIERAVESGVISYRNGESFYRYGAELDFQLKRQGKVLFANLGYLASGNKMLDGDPLAVLAPKISAMLGVSGDLNERDTLGLSVRATGARNGVDPTYLVNLFAQRNYGQVALYATIKNFLDEENLEPDVTNLKPSAYLESGSGITLSLGARVRFE